ncbi:MAG: AEC family transporter [Deltaproteobacteria bacterium]|nr:AEC family transporter [Deltaproteobacteria bacterium]
MIPVLLTILPIFVVIFLGFVLSRWGRLSPAVAGEVNWLVFYVAIPAMIFSKVSAAPFAGRFSLSLCLGVVAPVAAAFVLGLLLVRVLSLPREVSGTFVQSGFHGNLGYIGLAVAYYHLGDAGLAAAGVFAAFLMFAQNILGVMVLAMFAPGEGPRPTAGFRAKKILANPVILAAAAGIAFSLSGRPMPLFAARILDIVSGMALPLALLIIGASLSFSLLAHTWKLAAAAGAVKLLFVPAVGWAVFSALGHPPEAWLPALILLAAPTATITRIMAGEMQGSTELAAAAVSLNTLLSALTYIAWLSLIG